MWKHHAFINAKLSIIDMLGPRWPSHTWHGRHMYEESKIASSTGQKTRKLYYEKVFGHFRRFKASNPGRSNFFSKRTLMWNFWTKIESDVPYLYQNIIRQRFHEEVRSTQNGQSIQFMDF